MPDTFATDMLCKMHPWWCAANYLSVGQIYLQDRPLLERPLTLQQVQRRRLGHLGINPGLNWVYVHRSTPPRLLRRWC